MSIAMQFSPAMRPYANFLLISAGMVFGFLLFYCLGWVSKSMLLLLLALLFACLCFLLEVILSVIAIARGQRLLACFYSLTSIALFFVDRWLLEQAE
jgi:biotin transporter BioY